MSEWIHVCPEHELMAGVGVCASVRGRQVAIVRMQDDRLYGIENYDPFSKANVLSRGMSGDVQGQPVIISPIYKQHFSLETGHCIEDESVRIDVFDVKVLDGTVYVSASPRAGSVE